MYLPPVDAGLCAEVHAAREQIVRTSCLCPKDAAPFFMERTLAVHTFSGPAENMAGTIVENEFDASRYKPESLPKTVR